MLCGFVPETRGCTRGAKCPPDRRSRELGNAARLRLRGSAEERAGRCAVRVLLHEAAGAGRRDDTREDAVGKPLVVGDASLSQAASTFSSTGSSGPFAPGSGEPVPERSRGVEQDGQLVKKIADVPSGEGVPMLGVRTGPGTIGGSRLTRHACLVKRSTAATCGRRRRIVIGSSRSRRVHGEPTEIMKTRPLAGDPVDGKGNHAGSELSRAQAHRTLLLDGAPHRARLGSWIRQPLRRSGTR